MIEPRRIENRAAQTLYGRRVRTSLSQFQPRPFWEAFRKDLARVDLNQPPRFYSAQVYTAGLQLHQFTPATEYDYWAAIESLPKGVKHEELKVKQGEYAVFEFKGTRFGFAAFQTQIYREWMPQSGYGLDARPHFEILDERYLGPMNPNSVEDVYIPIKKK